MKTKKISWQAIAIVVLALVLIASIALGVSGAWFQDKDSETAQATMGPAVTIRLTKNGSEDGVETWNTIYKGAEGRAYPGDKLLGATQIVPGSATETVMRVKIVPTVTATAERTHYDAEHDMTGNETEGDVKAFEQRIADGLLDNAETSSADKTLFDQYNSYLINTMLAQTKLTGWTKATDNTDGTGWYYKDTIVESTTPITLFATDLTLSNKLTNGVATWTIKVELIAEAIQAANLTDKEGNVQNAAWNNMPEGLKGLVKNLQTERETAPVTP